MLKQRLDNLLEGMAFKKWCVRERGGQGELWKYLKVPWVYDPLNILLNCGNTRQCFFLRSKEDIRSRKYLHFLPIKVGKKNLISRPPKCWAPSSNGDIIASGSGCFLPLFLLSQQKPVNLSESHFLDPSLKRRKLQSFYFWKSVIHLDYFDKHELGQELEATWTV